MEETKPTYELVKDVTGKSPKARGPQVINAYGYEIKVPHPPKDNCKKCYGRGYIGQEAKTHLIIMCKKCYPMI
jgi:hypothetical protein